MRDHPIFHDAPASSRRVVVRQHGQGHGANVRFFLFRDVLEELVFAARYDERPCVGLLTGSFGIEDRGPFVEVTGFEGLEFADEEATGRRSRTIYAHLKGVLSKAFAKAPTMMTPQGLSPVGMFVHDPGGGAQLTEDMVQVHLSLFNIPFQVLLVADAPADLIGCYARVARGRFFSAAFHTVSRASARGEGEEE
ncbi:MAG: hypothetical protein AAGI01_03570 [Myxococcota bacterium]